MGDSWQLFLLEDKEEKPTAGVVRVCVCVCGCVCVCQTVGGCLYALRALVLAMQRNTLRARAPAPRHAGATTRTRPPTRAATPQRAQCCCPRPRARAP
jgi:hypothetical protein